MRQISREQFEDAVESILGEKSYFAVQCSKADINTKIRLVAVELLMNEEKLTSLKEHVDAIRITQKNLTIDGVHRLK